jgi:hypothetical protein
VPGVWAKVGSIGEGSAAKAAGGSRAEETADSQGEETATTSGWAEAAWEPEVESREARAGAVAVAVLEAVAMAVAVLEAPAMAAEAAWETEAVSEAEGSASKRLCPSR